MDIFDIDHKERLGREEVATRLRNLADMVARHHDIEFERGGMRFTVDVPDELERELTWVTTGSGGGYRPVCAAIRPESMAARNAA
jgi:amphi-Trp domain-containing protein